MHRSFCKCRGAACNGLAGHMRTVGGSLPTPALDRSISSPSVFLKTELYFEHWITLLKINTV